MSEVATTVFAGTRVVAKGVFTSAGSAVATDPTAVQAKIRRPNGVKLSKTYGVDTEVFRVSQGVYELRYVLDVPGDWKIGFVGTLGVAPIVLDEVGIKVRKPMSTA